MNERTIEFDRVTAALVVAAGLLFSSLHARAEDPIQVATVEGAAAGPTSHRTVVLPAMKAGGIGAGQVVIITERGARAMPATQFVQQQAALAPKVDRNSSCAIF